MSGQSGEVLEPRLRSLVRRELLAVEADPRSPERGQYAFVQALVRGGRLRNARPGRPPCPPPRGGPPPRVARHRGVGGCPRLPLRRGPPRLSRGPRGRRARGPGAAHPQGRRTTRTDPRRPRPGRGVPQPALTVTSDPVERADLLEPAGSEASAPAATTRRRALLRSALDLRRATGDGRPSRRATAALASELTGIFRTDAALQILEPAVLEFADLAGQAEMIAVRAQLARAWFMSGDYRRAIEVADSVLEVAEHSDLVAIVADVLVTKGSASAIIGRTYKAVGVIERATSWPRLTA